MTPSQLEAARAWLTEDLLEQIACDGRAHTVTHIRTLLSATAPPSEDDLAEEAARFACAATGQAPEDWDPQHARDALSGAPAGPWNNAVRAYIAGVRREGRR
jgi:hypothetical protein